MPVLNNHTVPVPVRLRKDLYQALRAIADAKGCQVHHLLEHLAAQAVAPQRAPQAGGQGVRTAPTTRHPQVHDGDPLLDDVRDLVKTGHTDVEVAHQLHLTREHAGALRRRLHLKPNTPRQQADQRRLSLYHQGLTDQQIAEAEHITREAIGQWRKRLDLPPNQTPRTKGTTR